MKALEVRLVRARYMLPSHKRVSDRLVNLMRENVGFYSNSKMGWVMAVTPSHFCALQLMKTAHSTMLLPFSVSYVIAA